ncbi:MAG TPA: ERCC4 domain-containing protein [Candidatus Acidoferrum sp.]|nr:ERCC4 domain-containing protein [Candidatus Acidoferrum sp.]
MRELRVIVDERERNKELMEGLELNGVEIDQRTIEVGDYVISDRVCIERKTVSDFESSLMSGRLLDQVERLKENYKLPIIILEGSRETFRLGRNVIIGALVALYIDNGIEVILSEDASETSRIIASIARHEQLENKREPALKGGRRARTMSHFQEYMIGNLPGIGPKLARALLSHFKSVKNIANADTKELMKVEKIGKKKAQAIHNTLNGVYILESVEP